MNYKKYFLLKFVFVLPNEKKYIYIHRKNSTELYIFLVLLCFGELFDVSQFIYICLNYYDRFFNDIHQRIVIQSDIARFLPLGSMLLDIPIYS